MRILVSNDDGYTAEGIKHLVKHMSEIAHVDVVAPDHNRSAASNSLTLYNPLRAHQNEEGWHYVNGTPADCVHLALTGLLDETPDIVVSGVNNGANLGEDVLYSGTVGAAMEGRHLGLPAVAVSLCSINPKHIDTGARVAKDIVLRLQKSPLEPNTILNVNVPDVPYEELKGIKITHGGHRLQADPAIKREDPRGRAIYWVGPPGQVDDESEGTDFHAVKNGYVSITPLVMDMTQHSLKPMLEDWIKD